MPKLLIGINRIAEAEKQAQAAVQADAGLAEAHELWGYLLAAKGDVDGAARELQSAVRLQPDSGALTTNWLWCSTRKATRLRWST